MADKRSAGVTPEVNQMNVKHTSKGINPPWLLSLGRCHQKSKLGVTVTSQKGLCLQKKLTKRQKFLCRRDTMSLKRDRFIAVSTFISKGKGLHNGSLTLPETDSGTGTNSNSIPMVTLYHTEHVHTAQTQTHTSTPISM